MTKVVLFGSEQGDGAANDAPITRDRLVAGKYELIEVAGRGGMATVWRAYQHGPGRFRRTVAVKQLFPHLASQPLYVEMFFEEARVGADLRDPNIAQIYDFVRHDDDHYLIIEWIEGIELATYIDYVFKTSRRTTRWETMAAAAIGILRGLAAAHERVDESGAPQPIVHRDVSPHNVVVSETGMARLIDFGLSLATDRTGDKTDPGIVKGKVAYLAPEVVRGGRPTPLSDQFSAGATLWEALAGRRLFDGDDPYQTLRKVAEAKTTPLAKLRPDLPPELVETVHRALALDSAHRFPSARDMANRLGVILARSRHWRDTYAVLGRTVREARQAMALGHRTQKATAAKAATVEESALIELDAADLVEPDASEI
jgi:serine/threonine-protein kinase